MAYATDHFLTPHASPAARAAASRTARRGLLARLADSLFETRQRKADKDIAAYIAHSGGKLTDSVERELMNHLSKAAFGDQRF